jgi:hypothetical protein
MKPRKHSALQHLFADGADIEIQLFDKRWVLDNNPIWHDEGVYRVRSKPDVVIKVTLSTLSTLRRHEHSSSVMIHHAAIDGSYEPNAKLIYDGETGELKDCEFIPPKETK